MQTLMTSFTAGFAFVFAVFAQPVQPQPSGLFVQLGLTGQQRAAIDDGRPVAKVLPWVGHPRSTSLAPCTSTARRPHT